MSNLRKFKKYILEILKKKFTDSEKYKEANDFVTKVLAGSSPKLDGKIFYNILTYIGLDIDETCTEYFESNNAYTLKSLAPSENLFYNLISPFINSQNQVSDSSNIKGKRFNRLFSGELTELYAQEINDLAIALNNNPSQLFEYFYNNGERPIVRI